MATASNIENEFETVDSSSLYSLSRRDRSDIANDTLQILNSGFYKSIDGSKISIAADLDRAMHGSVLYYEDDLQTDKQLILQGKQTNSVEMKTEFQILKCTTLQAAHLLAVNLGESQVGILNFASAKNPGGGFLRGSSAQEESIARSSSLYFCLNQAHFFRDFYNYHRRGERGIYSNRMIYSPHVTILKDDNGELLPSPYHVGVVTSPAPNASVCSDAQMIRKALLERIQRILQVFKIHQHDNIVLGSFGCGVFKNDRIEVASIFRDYLIEGEFRNIFKRVIFAVMVEDSYEIFNEIIINGKSTLTMAKLGVEKKSQTRSSTNGRNKKNNRRKQNQTRPDED